MSGALLGILAFVLVAATALAVAASLRLDSLGKLLIGAYVIAFAEIVGLVLLLSPFGAVRRPVLLVGLSVLSAAAIGLWWRVGRPQPGVPKVRSTWALLRRSPPLALLAFVVAAALGYLVALVVGTPPNSWDSLTYHLARAAFWRQDGGVGYIADAYDGRLNANPPNAEVALTFVLELAREERVAGLVQFGAAIVCAVAVFALARRLGLPDREAAFGGLLFLTLPTVVLQASTTLNDLVVAALLLAATVFLLGSARVSRSARRTALSPGRPRPRARTPSPCGPRSTRSVSIQRRWPSLSVTPSRSPRRRSTRPPPSFRPPRSASASAPSLQRRAAWVRTRGRVTVRSRPGSSSGLSGT